MCSYKSDNVIKIYIVETDGMITDSKILNYKNKNFKSEIVEMYSQTVINLQLILIGHNLTDEMSPRTDL